MSLCKDIQGSVTRTVLESPELLDDTDASLLKINESLLNVGYSIDPSFLEVLKGRYVFLKGIQSSLKSEMGQNDFFLEAVKCFKEVDLTTNNDAIKTLSRISLVNVLYHTGDFDAAIELCDQIKENEGEVVDFEVDFAPQEVRFHPMEENEMLSLTPHVFALYVKMQCLKALNKGLETMDREYIENMLERLQHISTEQELDILLLIVNNLDDEGHTHDKLTERTKKDVED